MGLLPEAREIHRQHLLEVVGVTLYVEVDHKVIGSE
jgi:hypothetical protein